MLFSIATLSLLLSATSASPAVTNPIARSVDASDALPFKSTFAFTAHLQLGKPLPTIAVPGGVLITEPIVSGTVCGPTINATIAGGLATPSVYENQTLQVPVIQAYGTTDDGFGFVINELGVGAPKGQITRIVSTTSLRCKSEDMC